MSAQTPTPASDTDEDEQPKTQIMKNIRIEDPPIPALKYGELDEFEAFLRRLMVPQKDLGAIECFSALDTEFLRRLATVSTIPEGAREQAERWFDALSTAAQGSVLDRACGEFARMPQMMTAYLHFRAQGYMESKARELGRARYAEKFSGIARQPEFDRYINRAWELITEDYLSSDDYLGKFVLSPELEEMAEQIAKKLIQRIQQTT